MRFGSIVEHRMVLSAAGEMVHRAWEAIAPRYPGLTLDGFVVMPNHFHGILTLPFPDESSSGESLSDVIGWFKTVTTRRYIEGVRHKEWLPFDGRLWQPSFHDRIVRNDAEMDRIGTYVANNPALWAEDVFYED